MMKTITVKKVYITYEEFGKKLKKLYKKVLEDGIPTQIVGIASGGLNLSKTLANWFDCRHTSVSINFYDKDRLTGDPYFSSIPRVSKSWVNVLLIDDIIDTGATIKYFKTKTGLEQGVNFKIASLHWNPKGEFEIMPDYYIDKKPVNSIIIYPWEKEFIETF